MAIRSFDKLSLLFLTAFQFYLTQPLWAALPRFTTSTDCDTMILSNGKVVLVKNLSWNDQEVTFSYCDDPENKLLKAPWQQVRQLKKTGADNVGVPVPQPKADTLSLEEGRLEREVKSLYLMAVLSVPALLLFGAGIILAFIVLFRSAKLKRAIVGHPNEAALRKKLRRARRIVKILLWILFAIGLFEVGYVFYLLSLSPQ